MAAVTSSAFAPQVDMIEQSLVVVASIQESESTGRDNEDEQGHEKNVEQNVILSGQVLETESPVPPTTTCPSDNDANDDTPDSQVAEPLTAEHSADEPPANAPTSPKFRPHTTSPNLVPMPSPSVADLTELILHSPSSQIIGTPFATDNTRFEYPFPETVAEEPSVLPSPPLSGTLLATITPSDSPSPKMGFHSHTAPSPVPSTTTSSPASISLASYGLPRGEVSVLYNPTHPKLKQNSNPPIPPSLAKKSKKWSLNLLGRRKSSSGQSSGSASIPTLFDFSSNTSSPSGSIARASLILDGGLSTISPPPASSLHGRGR